MKNKIGAIILGVAGLFVCSGFGVAEEGELMAFDKVYENPQAALKNNTNIVIPVAESQGISEEGWDRLPAMKDFLKDVPSKDRLEFLDSLVLKNGHIVSAYVGPLKRTLNKERVDEILSAIFINRRLEKKMSFENEGYSNRYTQLSSLLKDIPVDVKDEFLDNLAFRDGGFASAYVGGLRKVLKDEKLKEMLRSLTTDPNTAPKIDNPKALCWDGVCEDAGCFYSGGSSKCKDSETDSVCDTSCK